MKSFALSIIFLLAINIVKAQDPALLDVLGDSAKQKTTQVVGTFKGTRIVNLQTVEQVSKGALSFVIQHRFGKLNSGAYNFFGMDNATLRLAFNYGLTDRLAIGVGRSSYLKTFDGFVKYKLSRQTEENESMPVSISLLGTINHYTQRFTDKPYLTTAFRTSYSFQALIARKFSNALSLEIAPTFLRYNLVPTVNDKNNVFAIAAGGRVKLTKRTALSIEYNYLPGSQLVTDNPTNSFSFGYDIETGGHVFQLVFSNSQSMLETQYIGQTTGKWGKGDIYFGFNMARDFTLGKKKKKW